MTVNWKNFAIVACDIVIAAYLLLAVTAFNKPDVIATQCTEVKINIEQSEAEGTGVDSEEEDWEDFAE